MMNQCDLPLEAVADELTERSKKTGNLKKMKVVDKNT